MLLATTMWWLASIGTAGEYRTAPLPDASTDVELEVVFDCEVLALCAHPRNSVFSGFANTDLDYQLRQREITHLIMAGMIANTCLESTARYAREI